jgi:ankyrin repeat protein
MSQLLALGAQVNAQEKVISFHHIFNFLEDGWTALHFASHLGHLPVIRSLFMAGADFLMKENVTGPSHHSSSFYVFHSWVIPPVVLLW